MSPNSTLCPDQQAAPSKSASKKLRAREPAWIRCSELEQANREVEPLLRSYADLSPEQLKSAIKKRLREELGFISNPEFSDPLLGKDVFDSPIDLAPRKAELGIAAVRRSGIDMPIHLGRLCEAPLLNPEQERMLFQRMNYLLQQAEVHRSHLNPQRPSRVRMELIDRLIALAEWHRDRIVEANLRLVFSIVKKFVNPNNNFDDLLSDGIVALIRAVEKFDFDRGFRFSTYATQVIRRNSYRTVVVKQQERQKTVGGLQDLDLDLTDEGRESAISEKRWHELRSRLSVMLDDLDRREKLIIRARFSLGAHRKVHTLQSLANRLGVSKERVRQLERRAMEKLRAMAGKSNLAELEPQ
ncbi:sigma-70 family RNA polymerase sigma factor [Stieleria sp. JC731]|uniref:sigma-70 family RNA polymerase sigma factor n=1 Tax=Pirellulaceae TaxID=2691357 RepID=UPI001E420A87|nr:sigma-70 family RNA polymerase sigma factor [Stieleria sp. JC731]MCC9602955.1 sigma-70 family RNA polymerase sigma factor [Stieleria sp. JC731]